MSYTEFGTIKQFEYILLSDVLHWGDNNGQTKREYEMVMESWDMLKPTYEEQSEECRDFIYSLVK